MQLSKQTAHREENNVFENCFFLYWQLQNEMKNVLEFQETSHQKKLQYMKVAIDESANIIDTTLNTLWT